MTRQANDNAETAPIKHGRQVHSDMTDPADRDPATRCECQFFAPLGSLFSHRACFVADKWHVRDLWNPIEPPPSTHALSKTLDRRCVRPIPNGDLQRAINFFVKSIQSPKLKLEWKFHPARHGCLRQSKIFNRRLSRVMSRLQNRSNRSGSILRDFAAI